MTNVAKWAELERRLTRLEEQMEEVRARLIAYFEFRESIVRSDEAVARIEAKQCAEYCAQLRSGVAGSDTPTERTYQETDADRRYGELLDQLSQFPGCRELADQLDDVVGERLAEEHQPAAIAEWERHNGRVAGLGR